MLVPEWLLRSRMLGSQDLGLKVERCCYSQQLQRFGPWRWSVQIKVLWSRKGRDMTYRESVSTGSGRGVAPEGAGLSRLGTGGGEESLFVVISAGGILVMECLADSSVVEGRDIAYRGSSLRTTGEETGVPDTGDVNSWSGSSEGSGDPGLDKQQRIVTQSRIRPLSFVILIVLKVELGFANVVEWGVGL